MNIIFCGVPLGLPLYCVLNKEFIINRKELMLVIYYIRKVIQL